MKCLVWDPNNGDRTSASSSYMRSAEAAAERFAKHAHDGEKYRDVTVITIDSDGTETTHEFTVDVEHKPVFTARPRT